jgi:hypothetical protein
MLTDQQVDCVVHISGFVCIGLLFGAVSGFLVALARLIGQRRWFHDIDDFLFLLTGIVPGALTGAIAAIIVGGITYAIVMMCCKPGPKGGYVIPEGLYWLSIVVFLFLSLLSACVAAMLSLPDIHAKQKPWHEALRKATAWGIGGALIGAMAGIAWGFEGYFVVQNNSGPINSALAGSMTLAMGCFLWRLIINIRMPRGNSPVQQ